MTPIKTISPDQRRFFKRVDKRSRVEMTAYLAGHFRYDTMHSWNRSTSYACNMKLYNLGLDRDTENKLWDLIEVPEFYDQPNELIEEFGRRHNYLWQAGWNGCSGGYLVLYQGGTKRSEYRSFCTKCGQKNYTSVAKTETRCGVCNEETRIDFVKAPTQIFSYPGRTLIWTRTLRTGPSMSSGSGQAWYRNLTVWPMISWLRRCALPRSTR